MQRGKAAVACTLKEERDEKMNEFLDGIQVCVIGDANDKPIVFCLAL